ncbi:MAG TPA: gamma-glutamylcyclotransferase family protein [Pseudonocardiaceae bacterium]|jgi:gamma-glutamylcyclotransferase (GGCT)/AIG2-like uncharacterized protein YtfP|nr:gamma-glutamylcyclotransferase family protein [Pseudonocardiaceae bacterium]
MTVAFTDADFPAYPYPGSRPDRSFLHERELGRALRPGGAAPWSWRLADDDTDLDDWLADRGEPALAERIPVLAYGSNACPAKITWLRGQLGLSGPVVVLRATYTGLAAVWAAALRARDGQRPATLAAAPGLVETHAVWLATPEQVRVLDVCEGRGERYRLARLATGEIRTEDGNRLDGVLAYLGRPNPSADRTPLHVNGEPVRCAEVTQSEAIALIGVPGADGLDADTIDGAPLAEDWPDRVFVYGTLQPGGTAWSVAEPWCAGEPQPARLTGTLYDTGLGWPALRLAGRTEVPGRLLRLRTPAAALAMLDEYEGKEYRRVRVALPDGSLCWTYEWTDPVAGMTELTRGW